MGDDPSSDDFTPLQWAGLGVFVVLCTFPALEMSGFGFHTPFATSFAAALASASVGGVVGGLLICPRPWPAGLIGGLLAGPLSLVAIYYYTHHRASVWLLQVVLVQGIACLPGIGIGYALKRTLSDAGRRTGERHRDD
jgi:hypothetical protein